MLKVVCSFCLVLNNLPGDADNNSFPIPDQDRIFLNKHKWLKL